MKGEVSYEKSRADDPKITIGKRTSYDDLTCTTAIRHEIILIRRIAQVEISGCTRLRIGAIRRRLYCGVITMDLDQLLTITSLHN